MMYDYATHIAWDILSLTAKPMNSSNTYLVKRALDETGASSEEIKLAKNIVALINEFWMED